MTRRQARDRVQLCLIRKDPFMHSQIGIILSSIAKRYGTTAANKIILDFGLDKLGWKPGKAGRATN